MSDVEERLRACLAESLNGSVPIVDESGRHVGIITFLQNTPDGELYGWQVALPDNHFRSTTGKRVGMAEAVKAAIVDADAIGIVGAKAGQRYGEEPEPAGGALNR